MYSSSNTVYLQKTQKRLVKLFSVSKNTALFKHLEHMEHSVTKLRNRPFSKHTTVALLEAALTVVWKAEVVRGSLFWLVQPSRNFSTHTKREIATEQVEVLTNFT